jgi:hypothetical protein
MLGLRPTGEHHELAETPFVGALLSTGWYLVVADRCDDALVGDAITQSLSTNADVVACSIEEHVMFSAASFWSAGRRIWSVSHDAQKAADNLESSGELPAFFADVRETLFAQQAREDAGAAEVDFAFEVPLVLACRVAGFKHDDGEPERFDVLEPISGSRLIRAKPWWNVW